MIGKKVDVWEGRKGEWYKSNEDVSFGPFDTEEKAERFVIPPYGKILVSTQREQATVTWKQKDEESFAARESYSSATRGSFDAEGRVRS